MSELFSVKRKVRPARPTQKTPTEISEDGHSWAVSYADFLMVLLSFFILFFSMDKKERVSFIEDFLANQDQDTKSNDQKSLPKQGDRTAGIDRKVDRLPASIRQMASKLDGFYIDQKSSDRIIISFTDNIYSLGSFDLSKHHVKVLEDLLTKLEPSMPSISITFVGHTDGSTSFKLGNKYVGNNFDLSSLRATKALQNAVKLGFNPKQMFAQGVAEHGRASRTLSLIISPGGKTP
jgi:flagellar motor protein MotB